MRRLKPSSVSALLTVVSLCWSVVALPASSMAGRPAPTPLAVAVCQFRFGFATLHDALPARVGDCLDDEHYTSIGDSIQQSTGGMLAWRKRDNWTAFTDGYRTWVNGPLGIQARLNSERFAFEADASGYPRPGGATGAAATVSPTALAATPSPVVGSAVHQALKLQLGFEPVTIDPAKVSFAGEASVVMRVYSNLLAFNDQGQLVPEMAEAMPQVSGDGKTYTFRLRDGLTYSDGAPLTTENFAYAWKRLLDPAIASPYAAEGYAIAGAEAYHTANAAKVGRAELQRLRDAVSVQAFDSRTLVFILTAPSPWFLSVLATWCGVPVRPDLIASGGDGWTEPATYIGNGPYVLAMWTHDDSMVFRANGRYFRGPPAIDQVSLSLRALSQVDDFKRGELDVATFRREDQAAIDADPTLRSQKLTGAGGCSYFAVFDSRTAPFDDRRVRQAFSLAMDRAAFVRDTLGGLGTPADQLVPPDLPGHDGGLHDSYQHVDAARAAGLLAAAGHSGGAGLPPITWSFSDDGTARTRVASLASQIRAALGVTLTLDPIDPRIFSEAVSRRSPAPRLLLVGWCPDYPDPHSWYSSTFRSGASVLRLGYHNPQYDQAVDTGDHELDAAKRAGSYQQAAEILDDDVPAAFLWWSQTSLLVKPSLAGFQVDPTEYYLGQHRLSTLHFAS